MTVTGLLNKTNFVFKIYQDVDIIKDGNRFLEQIKFFGTNKILCKNCVIQKKINDGRTTWIVQRNKKRCYLKTNKKS